MGKRKKRGKPIQNVSPKIPDVSVRFRPCTAEVLPDGTTVVRGVGVSEYSFVSLPRMPIVPRSEWAGELAKLNRLNPADYSPVGRFMPWLVDRDTIGDAVAWMSPNRKFGAGWSGDAWRMRNLPLSRFTGDDFPFTCPSHFLGVSFRLDGLEFRTPERAGYVDPGGIWERQCVIAAGGGAYYLADECEGYNVIFSDTAFTGGSLVIGSWRGSDRVWVMFGCIVDDVQEWSIGLAFAGEVYDLYAREVREGKMPPRVFVEWVCETCRLPKPFADFARSVGFFPEKS